MMGVGMMGVDMMGVDEPGPPAATHFRPGQWVERLLGIGDSRFGRVVGTDPDGHLLVMLPTGHRTIDPAHSLRPADLGV